MKKKKNKLDEIGWREWVSFPELKIKTIKAKIDTGARTSALHVSNIKIRKKTNTVSFTIHPVQRQRLPVQNTKGKLVGERAIKSSNGETTIRPVVKTKLKIGKRLYFIELTLVNRDLMGFRLLLGRSALKKRFLVNPGQSFLLDKKFKQKEAKTKTAKTKRG
ncbi:MAG: ATP-dependent zinc protease [Candidatus Nitronauta litoralis]|uniref:ATP-dependent zinc protease n=1 Tax=Candidatus Nitronauta litoralis TaxID=2705533 RepID=A0A7T0G1J4_9BACT|nr:MAG: ATP-dependent zinc protease [Candidatus Nitronauta litoralis]